VVEGCVVVPIRKALVNFGRGVLIIHIIFRRNNCLWQYFFELSMMILLSSSSFSSLKALRGIYRLLFLLIVRLDFVTSVTLFIAVEWFSVCVTGKYTGTYVYY